MFAGVPRSTVGLRLSSLCSGSRATSERPGFVGSLTTSTMKAEHAVAEPGASARVRVPLRCHGQARVRLVGKQRRQRNKRPGERAEAEVETANAAFPAGGQ